MNPGESRAQSAKLNSQHAFLGIWLIGQHGTLLGSPEMMRGVLSVPHAGSYPLWGEQKYFHKWADPVAQTAPFHFTWFTLCLSLVDKTSPRKSFPTLQLGLS